MNGTNAKPGFDQIINSCRAIAENYHKNWKPINPDWPTITGAGYLRLSTEEQVKVEQGSLEQQIYLAVQEVETRSKQNRKNYYIGHFYIDAGISGTTGDREEFIALKRAIRRKEYSFVVFKEISRIARDGKLWKEFFILCNSTKTEIIIRGLPINPNDPTQVLQLDILASFSEYEAKVTSKRIRDSVFSAMVNNQKFNSTHKCLGLSPLVVNDQIKPGYYTPSPDELKIVIWIYETFLKYGSYQKTLEACNERKILNKNELPFTHNSLVSLLTNSRLVGKWYLNLENKDMEQDDLQPNEQYHEIDLPHGPVIPIKLWNKVQKAIEIRAGKTGKNTRMIRVYPLTGGLLKYHDGTNFRGYSGNGRNSKFNYYRNDKHNFCIRADYIEKNVIDIVTQIIENSPELQRAIKQAGQETHDNIEVLEQSISKTKATIQSLEIENTKLIKKLDFITSENLSDDDKRLFLDNLKGELKKNTENKTSLDLSLQDLGKRLEALKQTSFSWKSLAEHAKKVQEIMLDKDPVALKNSYYNLFKSIVIGPENEMGERTITYTLNGNEQLWTSHCVSNEVVETVGVEPTSERDSSLASTSLFCVLLSKNGRPQTNYHFHFANCFSPYVRQQNT